MNVCNTCFGSSVGQTYAPHCTAVTHVASTREKVILEEAIYQLLRMIARARCGNMLNLAA